MKNRLGRIARTKTLDRALRPNALFVFLLVLVLVLVLVQSSIAIRPIGPKVTANRLDQRPAVPQFKQPSSTTKSDARHEPGLDSSYKNAAGLALGGVSHMGEGLAGWV